jgi:xanthine dehydrogenase accessory factor
MNSISKTAGQLLDGHREFVLATIINRHGSTPRTAGTRMIIADRGQTMGTIGGGLLEAQVIQRAGDVLLSRRPEVIRFDMTAAELAAMDMICGGRLEVLLEYIDPGGTAAIVFKCLRDLEPTPTEPCLSLTLLHMAGETVNGIDHCLVSNQGVICGDVSLPPATVQELVREHAGAALLSAITLGDSVILIDPVLPAETVFLFGAGHVAQPTAQMAARVGFRVQVADDRAEFANADRFPDAEKIRVIADFGLALKGLAIDRSGFIVIVTRGHLHDQTVLIQALRTEAAYIGMIGSRSKRDHIFKALLKQGFTAVDLKRVHSPIGLEIGAETPAEIALSIVAELVKVRAKGRRS